MAEFEIRKKVYFVRHGESEANANGGFQGPDSPLSERGITQTGFIARRAARLRAEGLITSPYRRAAQTAEAIAETTGLTPEYSDLFVERMKPEGVNGKAGNDPEAGALWRAWTASLYQEGEKVGTGEDFASIVRRADRALEYLAERPESTLLVATHGFFLRTLVARILLGDSLTGSLLKRFIQRTFTENTSITAIRLRTNREGETSWGVWILNDHAHLG